jgi:putative peptidoglycan lipid II flippase
MPHAQHLLRSSLLVILIYGLSKVTGLIKLFLLTGRFGTGPDADAFTAAAQLPELLTAMLAGGALAAALIPVYSFHRMKQDLTGADELASTIFTLTWMVMGSICLLAGLFAPWLVRVLLLPDAQPSQQILTAELMRIVLLSTLLIAISGVMTSLLHARQRFLPPAWATVAIDVGQIIGLAFFTPSLGIHGAAWGSVLGGVMLVGVQIPAYRAEGLPFRLGLKWRLASVRETLRLMGPRVVTMGSYQAADLVFIRLASGLANGVISAYFYANLAMVGMPRSLFAQAVANVIFPTLAEHHNQGEAARLRQVLTQGLRVVWALVIPAALGLLVLGEAAVAFIFERGSFGPESTRMVYGLMLILSIRLLADSSQDVLALLFYAKHNTRTPMIISLLWMGINVGLSLWLVQPFGGSGLAWAASLSALSAALLFYFLGRILARGIDEAMLARTLAQIGLACGVMVTFVLLLRQLSLPQIPFLLLGGLGGGALYLGMMFHFNREEIHQMIKQVRNR